MTRQVLFFATAWSIAFTVGLLVAIDGNPAGGFINPAPPASSTAPASTCPGYERLDRPNLDVAMTLDRARQTA